MARVWICGCETGDFSEFGGNPGGTTSISTAVVRSGAYSLKCTGGLGSFRETTTALNLATAFARFYFYIAALPTTEESFFGFVNSGDSSDITRLHLTTSGTIKVQTNYAPGTVQGTGSAVLNMGAWNLIEVKTVIGAGSGVVEVKVNGVVDQTYTGLTNNGSGNIDRAYFGQDSSGVGSGDKYYDDMSIDNAAYCGAGQIIARQPKTGGTPTYDQYTKSSGADAGALWNNTPFSTTGNCTDVTNAHVQTAQISLFSATQTGHGTQTVGASDTVNACKAWLVGKTSAITASGNLASLRRRVNGTDTDTSISLTTSDAYYESAIFTTTPANLDLLEVGAVHGNSTRTHTIEDVGFMVEYAPAVATAPVAEVLIKSQAVNRAAFF